MAIKYDTHEILIRKLEQEVRFARKEYDSVSSYLQKHNSNDFPNRIETNEAKAMKRRKLNLYNRIFELQRDLFRIPGHIRVKYSSKINELRQSLVSIDKQMELF